MSATEIFSEEEKQFKYLLDMVMQKGGLDCRQYKINYLKRRFAVRMRTTQSKSYEEYAKILSQNPKEYDCLLDRLTINVSQFFRDPTVYQQLKILVIPELRKKNRVRIWSAGCANGEEPYSLAMLLKEELPIRTHIEILATDIDNSCLDFAKTGIYKQESVVSVPNNFKERYFNKQGEKFVINSSLKKLVEFKWVNLIEELPSGPFDVVVCRNVLIYFMRSLQEHLFRSFHVRLNSDGFLILGKAETLLGDMRKLYKTINIGERIYIKKN